MLSTPSGSPIASPIPLMGLGIHTYPCEQCMGGAVNQTYVGDKPLLLEALGYASRRWPGQFDQCS